MRPKNIILAISIVLLLVVAFFGYKIYQIVLVPNVKISEPKVAIFISSKDTFDDVELMLAPFLINPSNFKIFAEKRGYNKSFKAGKFEIKNGMNNHELLQALRVNIPVRVTFNNQERIEDLAGRIAVQLEVDSLSLLNAFKEPAFLDLYNVNEETVLALFVPNTYEFYWNSTANQFRDRMAKEYVKFWDKNRLEKASQINLTPIEVSILASIVQKETAKVSERPKVAGVYLNRLKIGMPLQADPTVIYGIKKGENNFDLVIKRVLLADLSHPSKYNTYDNSGLPPGLIFMPDVNAIDAVLNYEKHNFFYFCASVEKIGYHEFATTLPQHAINRRKYQKWINSIGINR
jgi:UPF0755 protein